MIIFLPALVSGCFLLLAFIIAINPRKVNIVANRWLAIFLVCTAVVLLDDPLYFIEAIRLSFIYNLMMNSCVFSLAPTLYFSISYFVTPAKTFEKKDLRHFLLLFMFLILFIFFWFLPREINQQLGENNGSYADILVGLCLIILPTTYYWFISYRKLLAHLQNVELFSSTSETVDLTWLRYFLWGLLVMIIAWFFLVVFTLPIVSNIGFVICLAVAFYLAYFALQQGAIFNGKIEDDLELKTLIEENEQPDLHRKQLLTEEQLTVLKIQLEEMMQVQKPYLNSELGLPKLAKMMQLSIHELSYLINAGFDDNFYGFVNHYRVEACKKLLSNPNLRHLSMISIADEAGFNSKTAFNTAFKKIAKMSPTEFQKSNLGMRNK